MFFLGKDTSMEMKQLIWHGDIEIALDKRHPLFASIIYDSCRDQLPQSVKQWVKQSSREHEPIHCESNFCIGYGTRQSMRSFVKVDNKSGLSQSLYTKYLLQHIKTPHISIGTMFERLNGSFTMGEDASIVAQMKPEFKDSTRQSFSLAAPLRHASASPQHKKWFRLSRFEAMPPPGPPGSSHPGFESSVTVQLGLCWDSKTQMPAWMKGKIFQTPDVLIRLSLEPSLFLNEAFLTVSMASPDSEPLYWLDESSLQVIPQNVRLSVPPDQRHFGPFEALDTWDGPIFPFDEISSDFQVMSRCHLTSLQRVQDSALKFRVFLLYQGCPIQCKGVINFHVPICQNMPNFKIANTIS